MSEQTINCPYCGKKFPLSKAVTHEIEERMQLTYGTNLQLSYRTGI